jgi:hypothetical protein
MTIWAKVSKLKYLSQCLSTFFNENFCGNPKVLSSLLFTGKHCLKVFLHKLSNGIGIMTQISNENIEKIKA